MFADITINRRVICSERISGDKIKLIAAYSKSGFEGEEYYDFYVSWDDEKWFLKISMSYEHLENIEDTEVKILHNSRLVTLDPENSPPCLITYSPQGTLRPSRN